MKKKGILEDIGGGWYAKWKTPKRKKVPKLSEIDKGVDGRMLHDNGC